ncbi:MAG: ABC transporter ATP-binding protein, partial [Oscillospiraceae bacterium]|nr:ABC transporter ATP-binding protein [Oscillospiraceae bacterium]
ENGEVPALSGLNFAAEKGELIAIVGPSGCGKSTMLSIVAGLERPTRGRVLLAGRELVGVGDQTGYMLQKDNLLNWRSIRSNVLIGLEIRKMLTEENVAYADSLLATYGLGEFRDNYPSQLSGGMRQRAALIRTLATRPDILLLDEAFSALDYQTRLTVTDDVYAILKKEGKTALIVTHDIPEGISMADRVVVLSARPGTVRSVCGISFAEGELPPLQRRSHPKFREYFNQIWKELDINV